MIDYEILVKMVEGDRIPVPRGLDRYTRRKVMKQLYNERRNNMSEYVLTVESCLDWDDSEERTEVLGVFDSSKPETLKKLVDGYWEYSGQEIMTDHVVSGVLESFNASDPWEWGRFVIVDLSDDEYYKQRFTFIVSGTGK